MTTEKIALLLAEILGIDDADITQETAFTPEYGIEPIDVAKLIIAVENKFDIPINDDEVADLENVGDLVRHINKILENE